MKKLLLLLICFVIVVTSQAQLRNLFLKNKKHTVQDTTQVADTTTTASSHKTAVEVKSKKTYSVKEVKQRPEKIKIVQEKKDWSKVDLSKRPADHFMVQTGFQAWTNVTDTINTVGLGRFFNFYAMFDKPSKTDPHFSTAYGLGITTDNMYFGNTNYVNLKGGSSVGFLNNGTNYFKKMKLTTIYLEAPVELRYFSNPEHPNKSWKFAVGAKAGVLLKAYTKAKDYVDNSGRSLYGTSYVVKERNNMFFNGLDARGLIRVGYGLFSIYSDFQLTPVFKSSYGPAVHNLSIGITISGL